MSRFKNRYLQKLTQEEESDLILNWNNHNDKKALEKLILQHSNLVAKIARGYSGYGLLIEDLIAEGNIGIIHAVKNYDLQKGFRFSTYATWWIKSAIKQYIFKMYSILSFSNTKKNKKLFFRVRSEYKKEANKQYGEKDKINEVAKNLMVEKADVLEMLKHIIPNNKSLNDKIGEDGDEWIEWISDKRESHETLIADKEEEDYRKLLFDKALCALNKNELYVINSRKFKEPPDTLATIGSALSISSERVRQIEGRAIAKLQNAIKHMTSEHSKDFL